MPLNEEHLEIRATHRYSFRFGEWGHLCGMAYKYVESLDLYRWCYVVLFSDGASDYWPVRDYQHYEVRVNDERSYWPSES